VATVAASAHSAAIPHKICHAGAGVANTSDSQSLSD
jgi:hypothetical protein